MLKTSTRALEKKEMIPADIQGRISNDWHLKKPWIEICLPFGIYAWTSTASAYIAVLLTRMIFHNRIALAY